MKKCPFCYEEIQDGAIKCRFCNELLVGNPLLAQPKIPWYSSGVTIWLSFIFFMPISLLWCAPLVWIHPTWSRNKKIITMVVMLVISLIAWQMIKVSLQYLQQYYGTVLQSTGMSL